MSTPISKNDFLNATLALMRGDVLVGREILRRDGATDVAGIAAKIYEAIEQIRTKAASELLVEAMKRTMQLEPPPGVDKDDYLYGVIAVEQIINDMVKNLHVQGLSTVIRES